MNEIKRGQIWLVNWSPGRGSEQIVTRPTVIIQTDLANLNPNYPNTVVLTISTKGHMVSFHITVRPSKENGLKEKSFIKCEQILTISKERLIKKLGILNEGYMSKIENACKKVLSFS